MASNASRSGSAPHARGRPSTRHGAASITRDQPRTRGDDARSVCPGRARRGSAPHARGRLAHGGRSRRRRRISPARAGTTRPPSRVSAPETDQPRTRGDDLRHRRLKLTLRGSAPHARGRPGGRFVDSQPIWISPARAGTTTSRPSSTASGSDQPRTRGDDGRGEGDNAPTVRISPARAGTTHSSCPDSASEQDQPRTRGDDSSTGEPVPGSIGSAPHARGRHALSRLQRVAHRISPARAGTTPA